MTYTGRLESSRTDGSQARRHSDFRPRLQHGGADRGREGSPPIRPRSSLVISNDPAAEGLKRAAAAGHQHRGRRSQQIRQGPRGVRARAAGRIAGAQDRARLPRRLHAAVDAVVRAAMGGTPAQHPPGAAAGLQGSRHPCARARRRREAARRDRAFRRAGDGFRPDHRAGRGAGARGDTEATLAARVLEVEHRIYPQALRWWRKAACGSSMAAA